MKSMLRTLALAAILGAGAVPAAFAQAKVDPAAAQALMQKSGCLACHAKDKKVVGPAHLDVANKYRTVKGAEDQLVKHIINGGAGVWGQIPMPPHKHIPEADVRTMVRYILTYK